MHRSIPPESDANVHERPTLPPADVPLARSAPSADSQAPRTERPTGRPCSPLTKEAVERRFLDGDFRGALDAARRLLDGEPENQAVRALAASSELRLRHRCIAKLGSLCRIPRFICDPTTYRQLALDSRAGFIAAMVDGTTSIEQILSLAGLPEVDTLAILVTLLDLGVIAADGPGPGVESRRL